MIEILFTKVFIGLVISVSAYALFLAAIKSALERKIEKIQWYFDYDTRLNIVKEIKKDLILHACRNLIIALIVGYISIRIENSEEILFGPIWVTSTLIFTYSYIRFTLKALKYFLYSCKEESSWKDFKSKMDCLKFLSL
jgi:hypothetical protein